MHSLQHSDRKLRNETLCHSSIAFYIDKYIQRKVGRAGEMCMFCFLQFCFGVKFLLCCRCLHLHVYKCLYLNTHHVTLISTLMLDNWMMWTSHHPYRHNVCKLLSEFLWGEMSFRFTLCPSVGLQVCVGVNIQMAGHFLCWILRLMKFCDGKIKY
jgi:hypothetical protein